MHASADWRVGIESDPARLGVVQLMMILPQRSMDCVVVEGSFLDLHLHLDLDDSKVVGH